MRLGNRPFVLAGITALLAIGVFMVVGRTGAQVEGGDTSGPLVAIDAYHKALAEGDSAAAVALLTDDILVQEGGHVENREEYLGHHLGADMEFASQVPSKREVLRATRVGDVAWVASSSVMEGEFNGRPIAAVGAELMVLSRQDGIWKIRSIHWSSYNKRAGG